MPQRAFIASSGGLHLSSREKDFFRRSQPQGLILFARNCRSKEQVKSLTASFREAVGGRNLWVAIDQEGGRVARLKPPIWHRHPPALRYGELYQKNPEQALEAIDLGAQLIAAELLELGINVNCAPVLDLPIEGGHEIIGDRAFGDQPDLVSRCGRAQAEGLLEGSVLPVIKHLPGHGRALADSHLSLPVIEASPGDLEARDFQPFKALADMPLAMTAHVLIPSLDDRSPVTTSKKIITEWVRGKIGFQGVLMSDDLNMAALSGSISARTRAALSAGCDLALYCGGILEEMEDVAREAPELSGLSEARVSTAHTFLQPPQAIDLEGAQAMIDEIFKIHDMTF